MSLRAALKEDFGIEVLLKSGTGSKSDPFLIEPCSALEATRTQLNLLRGLERGRGELWRLLTSEPAREIGPAIQRLRIATVLFTENEIINETRAYYFDVNQVDGLPDASIPTTEWSDPRTKFSAPFQIGWLHFDQAIDNNASGDALAITLQYSSLGAKAAIYIYGSANASAQGVVKQELQAVCDQVRKMHPDAESPWPVSLIKPFALQYFLIGDDMSIAGVGVLGPHLLKLRLTYFDDFKMRELMGEAVRELAQLVLNNQSDA